MTFDIDDLCFIDTEGRGYPDTVGTQDSNLPKSGTYRYVKSAFTTVATWGIGATQPIRIRATDTGWDEEIHFDGFPDDLKRHWEAASKPHPTKRMVAWNMGFDRQMLNMVPGAPRLEPEGTLCAMAQAQASQLPPDLMSASKAIGRGGKQVDGKYLIGLFCTAGGEATPQSHPEEWARFKSYAITDTDELRAIWLATRQLPLDEWEQYWAHDRINERGVAFDRSFASQMARIAEANIARINGQIFRWTNGQIEKVTQTAQIGAWVYDTCGSAEVRDLLTKEMVEVDAGEDGEGDMKIAKVSIARDRLERAVAYYERKEKEEGDAFPERDRAIRDVLEARMYGGSATPAKFSKMLAQCDGDRLKGQYVYNGAAQSGRYSSKGIQIHNLTRDVLKDKKTKLLLEELAIAFIQDLEDDPVTDAWLDELAQFGPIARTQSLLVRPTLIAPKGKLLVACDWSAIEARVLPWLAASTGAEAVLQRFRENDADKSAPDAYMLAAAPVYGVSAEEINKLYRSTDPFEASEGKKMRGVGKVIVLSLGFGGGVGALHAMAAGYGVYFTDEEASRIVKVWRDANPWARAFWDAVWKAIAVCLGQPGQVQQAGRLAFLFDANYLGGSLFMALPDGRLLTYPAIKWEMKQQYDRKTKTYSGEERLTLTFLKQHTRVSAWFGLFVNNAVQGTAASMQRRFHAEWGQDPRAARYPIVMHTHDENVIEADEDDAPAARELLHGEMARNREWNEGLPIAAEATTHWYYSKSIE